VNKTVVVYKSKYGYTETYVKMITEELGCELFEASQITSEKLLEYETIIYGGGQRRSLKCEVLT